MVGISLLSDPSNGWVKCQLTIGLVRVDPGAHTYMLLLESPGRTQLRRLRKYTRNSRKGRLRDTISERRKRKRYAGTQADVGDLAEHVAVWPRRHVAYLSPGPSNSFPARVLLPPYTSCACSSRLL